MPARSYTDQRVPPPTPAEVAEARAEAEALAREVLAADCGPGVFREARQLATYVLDEATRREHDLTRDERLVLVETIDSFLRVAQAVTAAHHIAPFDMSAAAGLRAVQRKLRGTL